MGRKRARRTTRRVEPGTIRADEAGSQVDCLLVAPYPDWVAIDLATGALLRASGARDGGSNGSFEELMSSAGPLSALSMTLQPAVWDPARPEAVELRAVALGRVPRKRSARRLLRILASPVREPGLLGSVGPSVAYRDLTGDRPSVRLVAPRRGRLHFQRSAGRPSLRFTIGDREHTLPVASGAEEWAALGSPGLLTVGYDAPAHGQVRKVVLGVLPEL